VEPCLSEDLTQQIRSSVEHLRLSVEALGGGHETGNLHDAAYVVQAPGLSRSRGEGVQGAQPGSFLSLFEGYGVADLAGLGQFTSLERNLAGSEDEDSGKGSWDVGSAWLRDGGNS
jgi:hypothetical protein